MVSITGLLAAIEAPVTGIMIGRLDRRFVLVGFTLLQVISCLISAYAQSFPVMMVARVFLGFSVGGFWAISIATGARLVPKHKMAQAVAIITGAISIATIISVPAGTLIGSMFNWRIPFIASAVLGLLVFWDDICGPRRQKEGKSIKLMCVLVLRQQSRNCCVKLSVSLIPFPSLC